MSVYVESGTSPMIVCAECNEVMNLNQSDPDVVKFATGIFTHAHRGCQQLYKVLGSPGTRSPDS